MALGRRDPNNRDERFSMAVLALNTSSYRNAVSRLHREVSQEMWSTICGPQLPVWEVPITSITNGVHLPSWLNGDLAPLYDQYLQPDWRDRFNEPGIWEQVRGHSGRRAARSAPPAQTPAGRVSCASARHASALRRQASAAESRGAPARCSIPNALTIGFARRFATYKRATLLFRDVERLKRILLQ